MSVKNVLYMLKLGVTILIIKSCVVLLHNEVLRANQSGGT